MIESARQGSFEGIVAQETDVTRKLDDAYNALLLKAIRLNDATEEIQVRMGISNSSNHLRTARLNILQAGAATRIGEMDSYRADLARTETRIKQAREGFTLYMGDVCFQNPYHYESKEMKTASIDVDNKLSLWQNLRLMPLFSVIFGGILLLFALCIGLASYFLIQSNNCA
ncbi:hypothetical protein CRX72_20840 [Pantoea sp. BRM17]|nr:hypothetical protein CRX72_20840 [Pantoea sp. BRM17]